MSVTVKSLILDIADTIDPVSGAYMGIRAIRMYKDNTLISLGAGDITCYATDYVVTNGEPAFAFDTSLALDGAAATRSWYTNNGVETNMRLICVLNTAQDVDFIKIDNFHNTGSNTVNGAKTVRVASSTDAISDTTYNAAITNETVWESSIELAEHVVSNVQDSYLLSSKLATGVFLKTCVVDVADNWGDADTVSIRALIFYKNGQKITVDTAAIKNVYATSFSVNGNGERMFYSGYSLTGSYLFQWTSAVGQTTNQRIVLNLKDTFLIDYVLFDNAHDSGANTDNGAKNIVVTITQDYVGSAVYNDPVSNGTVIFDGTVSEHVALDQADSQTILFPDEGGVRFVFKTLILEIEDNHGSVASIGCRSLEFLDAQGVVLPLTNEFTTYGSELSTDYQIDYMLDTTLSKTGAASLNAWVSASSTSTRLAIVFDNLIGISSFRVNNAHDSGASTDIGINNVSFIISEEEITDTTFGAIISSGKCIFKGTLSQHPATDTVDDQDYSFIPDTFFFAKSLIIDIDDNHGSSVAMGLRSISLFDSNNDEIVLTSADFTAYATTTDSVYAIEDAFITALSKTGAALSTSWLSNLAPIEQRIILVLNVPVALCGLSVCNYHDSGADVDRGINTFVVYGIDTAYTDTTYDLAIGEAITIFDGSVIAHSGSDVANEQKLVLEDSILTAYPIFILESFIESAQWKSPSHSIHQLMNSFGDNSIHTLLTPLGISNFHLFSSALIGTTIQSILLQYGYSIQYVQAIINEVRSTLENATPSGYQLLMNSIDRNDVINGVQILRNALVAEAFGIQVLTQSLSNGYQSIQALLNVLSNGAETPKIQGLLNTIAEKDSLSGFQALRIALQDAAAHVFSTMYNQLPGDTIVGPTPGVAAGTAYAVYLDGILINRYIGEDGFTIEFNQSSIHNAITISSISEDLFLLADPNINSGTPRLEIHIGTRVMYFLIEKREGSDAAFTIWGRDITARESAPWAEKVAVSLEAPQSASSIAEEVLVYSTLNWEISEFVLEDTFVAEGTPIEIIQMIASEIGAILRAQDDGSITIRYKYPTRPIDLDSSTADITYTDDFVVDFAHSREIGNHYNRVAVVSQGSDKELPIVEVEDVEGDRIIGDTAYVNVYWTNDNPDLEDTYVSDGIIRRIGGPYDGKFQEEVTELIEFSEGVGETKYPIRNLKPTGVQWIGDTANVDNWEVYSSVIDLGDVRLNRLAYVTYTKEYTKYELSKHNVPELLGVFFFDETPGINVMVTTPRIAKDENGELIDKTGDDLTISNIKNEAIAVLKGKVWIDDNKYDEFIHSFGTPYRDACKDGIVAWVDCSRIGKPGNFYVTSASIIAKGPVLANTLEIKTWQI